MKDSQVFSACGDILMQGLAHSAGAVIQLGHHALDALAQAGGIQIHAEHILTAVKLLQAAHILGALFHLQRRHDGLQLLQQVSGEGSKGFPASSTPLR